MSKHILHHEDQNEAVHPVFRKKNENWWCIWSYFLVISPPEPFASRWRESGCSIMPKHETEMLVLEFQRKHRMLFLQSKSVSLCTWWKWYFLFLFLTWHLLTNKKTIVKAFWVWIEQSFFFFPFIFNIWIPTKWFFLSAATPVTLSHQPPSPMQMMADGLHCRRRFVLSIPLQICHKGIIVGFFHYNTSPLSCHQIATCLSSLLWIQRKKPSCMFALLSTMNSLVFALWSSAFCLWDLGGKNLHKHSSILGGCPWYRWP